MIRPATTTDAPALAALLLAGRTDLPGGNHAQLIASIREKLLPLGDDIGFICGHGPGGNFGQERKTNPFLV